MFRLDGQVAIVTGGAQGIGGGICEVFLEAGATVALWDVADGQPLVDKLKTPDNNIFYQKVNVADVENVQTAVAEVMEKYGRIDILANNAGIIRDRSFMKMEKSQWDQVMDVNVNSLFITSKAVLPHMIEAKYGRIISASSINANRGAFGQTNYCASKAAVQGFTRALCKEVGKHGITVNAIAPGFVKSAMTDSIPKEMIEQGIKMIPIRRIGQPRDLGYVYLFLASKESAFVSGTTIHANGGEFAF